MVIMCVDRPIQQTVVKTIYGLKSAISYKVVKKCLDPTALELRLLFRIQAILKSPSTFRKDYTMQQ